MDEIQFQNEIAAAFDTLDMADIALIERKETAMRYAALSPVPVLHLKSWEIGTPMCYSALEAMLAGVGVADGGVAVLIGGRRVRYAFHHIRRELPQNIGLAFTIVEGNPNGHDDWLLVGGNGAALYNPGVL